MGIIFVKICEIGFHKWKQVFLLIKLTFRTQFYNYTKKVKALTVLRVRLSFTVKGEAQWIFAKFLTACMARDSKGFQTWKTEAVNEMS